MESKDPKRPVQANVKPQTPLSGRPTSWPSWMGCLGSRQGEFRVTQPPFEGRESGPTSLCHAGCTCPQAQDSAYGRARQKRPSDQARKPRGQELKSLLLQQATKHPGKTPEEEELGKLLLPQALHRSSPVSQGGYDLYSTVISASCGHLHRTHLITRLFIVRRK